VRHAVRVQEQLASLHAQLERDQQGHAATEAPKDSSVPSMGPRKRSVGHDDESSNPPRETKRIRIESNGKGPRRHMPPPTPGNGTKPGPQAPGDPLSPKEMPIASRLRSGTKSTKLPLADSPKTQGTNDSSPSRLPIRLDTVPPTPPNNTNPNSSRQTGTVQHAPLNDNVNDGNHKQVTSQVERRGGLALGDPVVSQTHTQNKVDKAPSLSISTSIPDAQGSPLST
jgi:hypothetical protein